MSDELTLVFRAVDLLGVVLNGVIGGTIARQRRFDAVGFAVLAIISALGGGLLRDTLLQAGRPVALVDPWYLVCALAGAAIAFVMNVQGRFWERAYPVADALVLGSWAAAGATKSLSAGLDWLPALLLGITTAVGGGMIRDIAVGEVPEVFGGNTLYATPALVSAGIVVAGDALGGPPGVLMACATLAGATLALLARRRGWQLPVHGDGTVTMTKEQLASLIRRVERGSLRRRRDTSD